MEQFTAPFIQSARPFDPSENAAFPAPIFRRKFTLRKTGDAVLRFCALGYGYCYINGKPVTEDLFTAPVSQYEKLVWYHRYSVTPLLQPGENVIAVILGNGFFNENFPSHWDTNLSPWRNHPRFALSLEIDGETLLESDEEFLYTEDSFVTYNQLRSGETFDARRYDKNWKSRSYDDSAFCHPVKTPGLEGLTRKLCPCEPIREFEEYDFIHAQKTQEGYLLDFGVNISGYLRICVDEAPGTVIELRHAEEAFPDGRLKLNRLDIFYPTVDFQVDRYICGDTCYTWSPKFTYHGFRYVLVKGLTKAPEKGQFKSVFVHQAVARNSEFSCSEPLLNWFYQAALRSSLSNMHYALTDCPTREKFGWTNDAQGTIDQLYLNFQVGNFMQKWCTDILTNLTPEGKISGVIPPHFADYACGPVCDGLLFLLPYTHYLHTGDPEMLIRSLPYMQKYYTHYDPANIGWLGDWDGHVNRGVEPLFIGLFYKIRFCRILLLAQALAGQTPDPVYERELIQAAQQLKNTYIHEDGTCVTDNQSAISMLLHLRLYDTAPLVRQLKQRLETDGHLITAGMLGLQYLFPALFENGLAEDAWALFTQPGGSAYRFWYESGATSLWETWEEGHTDSRNHHMLSCPVAWLFRGFLGISPQIDAPGYAHLHLTPAFVAGMDHCSGWVETPHGKLEAAWKRDGHTVTYKVLLPAGLRADFRGQSLHPGENLFFVEDLTCV